MLEPITSPALCFAWVYVLNGKADPSSAAGSIGVYRFLKSFAIEDPQVENQFLGVCPRRVYFHQSCLEAEKQSKGMSTAAVHTFDRLDDAKRKVRELFELIVAYALILLTIWTSGITQRILLFTAASWIVATTALLRHEDWEFGLRPSQLRRSWWIVAAAGVIAAGAFGISAHVGTLHLPAGFEQRPWRVLGYVSWSFVQQFILQDYFLLRLRRQIPSTSIAVATVAVLFSLAHLPNMLLTVAALIWGFISSTLFLRYRNLYSLGIAHAIFGLCIALTVPDAVQHRMRVGLGYLTYQGHAGGHSLKPQ